MIEIEERGRLDGRVEASLANAAPRTRVVGVSALLGTGLETGQPRPDLGVLDAGDRIATARGLVTGLVVSAMMWVGIIVAVWQGLH